MTHAEQGDGGAWANGTVPIPTAPTCILVRDCGEPEDQTPWGIEVVYNDSTIAQTSGGSGVDVAVIDFGVLKDHIDLKRRVVTCLNFLSDPPLADCDDDGNHGTYSASIIAADGAEDGLGLYGVAPDARIHALKACSVTLQPGAPCPWSALTRAIEWATENDIEVISASWGAGHLPPAALREAVEVFVDGGGLFIASAGNSGPEEDTISYPAAYSEAVAVGNMAENWTVVNDSSRGNPLVCCDNTIEDREVEFAAPGTLVLAIGHDGQYRHVNGTSFAAPHVAGLAAKLWAGDGNATRQVLKDHAVDVTLCYLGVDHCGAGFDIASGFGLPVVSPP